MAYVYSRVNIIISLKSAYRAYRRINSELALSGNIYKVIPITFNIVEQLFISAEAHFLPFANCNELPFSKVGG